MANVTSEVAAEVVPELANVSIMFKAVIVLALLGFIIGIIYTIYHFISD